MKVFISWSGSKSHKVALVFYEWLPSVIQSIVPYVSSENISKGARWSTDIATELADSQYGILCVTKESLDAPWLSFEAGALSKTLEKSYVSPFLFDIKRSEVDGPILQFQSTTFDKKDVKKLINSLNRACGDNAITEARLSKAFDVWYPKLEEKLNKLKDIPTLEPRKEKVEDNKYTSEILEEILELTRTNQKILRSPETIFPSKYLNETMKNSLPVLLGLDQFRIKQNYSTLEIEHRFNQIQKIMENYKEQLRPVDDELEHEIYRLIDFIKENYFKELT